MAHGTIIATEYKGQSSILLFSIRLLEKHLNILQAQVFYLLHTGGATSPPLLLTISIERKDHDTEIAERVISICESPNATFGQVKRNHSAAGIRPQELVLPKVFQLKLDASTLDVLPAKPIAFPLPITSDTGSTTESTT